MRAICRDFDHIGFLCRKELLPVKLVAETYHRNILDMWDRLERFIYKLREESGNENLYWEFEWLTHKADEARKLVEKDAEVFRKYNRKIVEGSQL